MPQHDSDPSYVLAMGGTFLALAPIVCALRFYNRSLQRVGIGIDDWLILPATLLVMGCAITLIVGTRMHVFSYPTPKPTDPGVTVDNINTFYSKNEQIEWAFFLMQVLAMGLIKLSFIFFYRRIFAKGHAFIFNVVTMTVAALITAWMLAFFLWFLLACRSDEAARWTSVIDFRTQCPTWLTSLQAFAISDLVTDVIVFTLPVPMVLRLHTTVKRKLAILGVFAVGAIAMAASIIRLVVFVYTINAAEGDAHNSHVDNNLLATKGLYWATLEAGLALIACCLPTLNALRRHKGLESMVRSVLSMTSLKSKTSKSSLDRGSRMNALGSDKSGGSGGNKKRGEKPNSVDAESQQPVWAPQSGEIRTEASSTGKGFEELSMIEGIRVEHDLEQDVQV